MDVLTGLYHVVAAVLVVGGVAKIRSPRGFEAMALAAGRRVPRGTGRVVGAVEVTMGVVAIATGAPPWSAALALLYAAFAGVVVIASRRGATSCGCFGSADAPPGPVHVVVDATAAAVAVLMVFDPPGSLAQVLAAQPAAGVPYVMVVAVTTALVVVALTGGATLLAEVRRVAADRDLKRAA